MASRIKAALRRGICAAIGAAIGAGLGGLVSRRAASTAGGAGALAGATIADKLGERSVLTLPKLRGKEEQPQGE